MSTPQKRANATDLGSPGPPPQSVHCLQHTTSCSRPSLQAGGQTLLTQYSFSYGFPPQGIPVLCSLAERPLTQLHFPPLLRLRVFRGHTLASGTQADHATRLPRSASLGRTPWPLVFFLSALPLLPVSIPAARPGVCPTSDTHTVTGDRVRATHRERLSRQIGGPWSLMASWSQCASLGLLPRLLVGGRRSSTTE